MDLTNLASMLQKDGINTDLYGAKGTKSIQNLLDEIIAGESRMDYTPENRLIREVRTLSLIIKQDGKVLREEWQQRPGQDQKPRKCVLAEKMLPDESNNITSCIERAIDEELGSLGVKLPFTVYHIESSPHISEAVSSSYPGLMTRQIVTTAEVFVDNLPRNGFITREYEKNDSQRLRLTTSWDWVDPIPENFGMKSIKDYFAKN